MKDLHLKILALILIVSALGLCYYKIDRLGVPLTPQSSAQVWTAEATVRFNGENQSAKIDLAVPKSPPGFSVLDENFISAGFGLATDDEGANRVVQWAARNLRANAGADEQADQRERRRHFLPQSSRRKRAATGQPRTSSTGA